MSDKDEEYLKIAKHFYRRMKDGTSKGDKDTQVRRDKGYGRGKLSESRASESYEKSSARGIDCRKGRGERKRVMSLLKKRKLIMMCMRTYCKLT